MYSKFVYDWHVMFVMARKDPSGSSSDDGGFLREGAEGEGAGDSGHTLPVRNSRSVQSTHLLIIARRTDRRTHLFISTFLTLRLRCSTIYDLHTNSLLWCFVDGLRFCRAVMTLSIKRFDLPDCVGVTKTRSNQLMLCSVYCIILAQ